MNKDLFHTSKEESELIYEICHRIVERYPEQKNNFMHMCMDIDAVHSNGCPLDLEALKLADDYNLSHDVFGIRNNVDRETGKLLDCFVPRFAKKQNIMKEEPRSVATRAIADRQAIRYAIEIYYEDLDNRKHGGIAANQCLDRIQEILGMSWGK